MGVQVPPPALRNATVTVRVRGEAQRRLYSIDPAPLAELDAWLARYRPFWAQRLDALDTQLARKRRKENA